MPRKAKPPPKRRPANTGSVGTRADDRVFAILPKELDPKRQPHYGPGKRRRFSSEDEASVWLASEIARRLAPVTQAASATEPLGAYLARWFDNNAPSWPERTVVAYEHHLRRWKHLGTVPLGSLTREVVQGGVADLQRATWQRKKKDGTLVGEPKPYSARTIRQSRGVLHQALEDLIPDVLTHNPARARRRSRKEADPEQPVWSLEQADRFLRVADGLDERVALGFRLILRRALRIGEVVDLERTDVDERNGTLTVDETPGLKRGTSGPTKTRRTRDVPLSADLIRRLREHRHAYPTTDPHLFTVQGERISIHYFRELWQRAVRIAQVPFINPKDGRATCATHLLDAGWPLPEVSRLLGHTNIATTSLFYARVVKRRADQTIQLGEKMDAAFDPSSQSEPAESAESGE